MTVAFHAIIDIDKWAFCAVLMLVDEQYECVENSLYIFFGLPIIIFITSDFTIEGNSF